jgi:hypothetical protein
VAGQRSLGLVGVTGGVPGYGNAVKSRPVEARRGEGGLAGQSRPGPAVLGVDWQGVLAHGSQGTASPVGAGPGSVGASRRWRQRSLGSDGVDGRCPSGRGSQVEASRGSARRGRFGEAVGDCWRKIRGAWGVGQSG